MGCRNDGSITLPDANGQFICPDPAYTTGNLGKGWNELDLVPYRIELSAGTSAPASQSYSIAVALDREDAGHPGYDVLSALRLNGALSAGSCPAAADLRTLDAPSCAVRDAEPVRWGAVGISGPARKSFWSLFRAACLDVARVSRSDTETYVYASFSLIQAS